MKSLLKSIWNRLTSSSHKSSRRDEVIASRPLRVNNNRVVSINLHTTNIEEIEEKYNSLKASGYFSGGNGQANKEAFLAALFVYDERGRNAFTQALYFSDSWRGNSVEPFKYFLKFIVNNFFQDPASDVYKQVILRQYNGQGNALSQAAWAKNPTPIANNNPLKLLLAALAQPAGYFVGSGANENKQHFINAVFAPNQKGENAIFYALRSLDMKNKQDPCPNLKLLLDELTAADCFVGPTAETNKQAFIHAILTPTEYGGVLSEVMYEPPLLQLILDKLKQAGCFNSRTRKQAFIMAIFTQDRLGRNPLFHAAHIPGSLKLVLNKLIALGCFTGPDAVVNKQHFINAVFAQAQSGDSALHNAADYVGFKISLKLIFDALTLAGCFEGPAGSPNQQAFITAVLAENEYGDSSLYTALDESREQLLRQLAILHCFDGPFSETNKKAFVRTILSQNSSNKGSALARNPNSREFSLIMEKLSAADCFSGDANKKTFIAAVFASDTYGRTVLSQMYRTENLRLLLEKLAEAGCFDRAESCAEFMGAIKADGNAILFHVMSDLQCYLTLRKYLFQAGCTKENLAAFLNQGVVKSYSCFDQFPESPFMAALESNQNSILINQLKLDGAELSSAQSKAMEALRKKRNLAHKQIPLEDKAEEKHHREMTIIDLKQSFTTASRQYFLSKPRLPHQRSFPDLTLFASQAKASSQNKSNKIQNTGSLTPKMS